MGKILTATAQEPPLFASYLPSSQVRKPKGTHPVSGIHVYLPTPSIPFHCSILPQMAKFYFPSELHPVIHRVLGLFGWKAPYIFLLASAFHVQQIHVPGSSDIGLPILCVVIPSVPPFLFRLCVPDSVLSIRGRGIPGSWEGRRALGPWLGAGNREGLRRQPAVPSGLWCCDKHSTS